MSVSNPILVQPQDVRQLQLAQDPSNEMGMMHRAIG